MQVSLTYSVLTTWRTWVARVTRSRATVAFFVLFLASYAVQITLHAVILSGYLRSLNVLTSAIDAAGVQRGFTAIKQDVLELCSGIPTLHASVCLSVYNASAGHTQASTSLRLCAEGLTWPENHLRDAISEEVVYLLLETWLLVLSVSALICQSIPHLIVVLAAQAMKTGWASFRFTSESLARRIYRDFVVKGACGGFDILGGSWKFDLFYMALGFSIAALLGMLLFVFLLVKLYSKETLSIVGSCRNINRMLKWWLCMGVCLQLAAFFILASATVWFCKRKLEMIAPYSQYILHDAGFYSVAIIIPPWLALGLHSISNEKRLLFLVHAFLSACLLSVSAAWANSALFRYEYAGWRFLSCVTTVAGILLVITCVLSIVCRINFGKGLAHFLVVEQKLRASGFTSDIFTHDVPYGSSKPCAHAGKASSRTSQHRPASICSVESAVIATWLPSSNELWEGVLQAEKGRSDGIIIISKDGRASFGTSSVSSDESGY